MKTIADMTCVDGRVCGSDPNEFNNLFQTNIRLSIFVIVLFVCACFYAVNSVICNVKMYQNGLVRLHSDSL